MSSFLGIEKEKDCVYLYVILDSRFREMEAEQDEERDQYYFSVPDSVREEADRQVEQWMGEPRRIRSGTGKCVPGERQRSLWSSV